MKKRNTIQKTIILDALKELCTHPTPAEVYEHIHEKYPSISQATVFRVLLGESEDGEVQRFHVPGGTRYEYGLRKHYHAYCRLCGKIADVDMPYMDDIESKSMPCDNFTIEGHIIEFVGLCPECKAKSDEI